MHPNATPDERQRDPTRADAELERGPVAGEIRQEGDDGVDDGRVGLVRVPLVESLCDPLAEVVLRHSRNLAREQTRKRGFHRVSRTSKRLAAYLSSG